MRLRKKENKQQRRPFSEGGDQNSAGTPANVSDPKLPGLAGYRGVGRLKKNAMPVTRFTYRRPDGRD